MKKTIFTILSIILVIALVVIGILLYNLFKIENLYNDNKPLYCIFEGTESTGNFEFYFYFKDGILNNYTRVNTRKPFSETGFENIKKMYDESDSKYDFMTSKLVQDSEKLVITENYNFEGFTIEELLNQNADFLYEKKQIATRSQILEIFEKINIENTKTTCK